MVRELDTDRLQQLGQAHNAVIEAKLNHPGDSAHKEAIITLAKIVAENPHAIDMLQRE